MLSTSIFLQSESLKVFLSIFHFSAPPIKAVVSKGMYCSCDKCLGDTSYHWYKKHGESWVHVDSTQGHMAPDESGIYACRGVWKTGRSSLSKAFKCKFLLMDIKIFPLTY